MGDTNESRLGPGEQEESHTSYDSSVYDIYEEFEEEVVGVSQFMVGRVGVGDEEEWEWGEVEGPGHLTLDFDDIDRQNILKEYNRLKVRDGLKDL